MFRSIPVFVLLILLSVPLAGQEPSAPSSAEQTPILTQRAPAETPEAVAVLPAGTVLQIRLRQTLSSYGSKRDSPILAEVIAPVEKDGKVILPMRTELVGKIRDVRKVGLGFSRETAMLDLEFNTIRVPGGRAQDLVGRVTQVDDAREQVDSQGRIRGIRATDTFANTLAGVAVALSAFDPMALCFGLSSSLSIFRVPDSSIILPTGTELRFEVGLDVAVPEGHPAQHPPLIDSDATRNQLRELVQPLPFRTATEGANEPSDLTSLLYLGSEDAIEKAFLASGWVRTDELDTQSTYGVMRSIIENQGYRAAPMSVLVLDGKRPTFTLAKTLNTFFSRHHLRIYPTDKTYEGKPVWTSTATYDSGIGFSRNAKTFIHLINENIDEERDKVVNDLVLTGCVDGVGYLDRPWVPLDAKNATGDSLRTDARIAILDMNACTNPVDYTKQADELPEVSEKLNPVLRPFRNALLTIRNDLTRGNMIYQGYAGIKLGLDTLRKPAPGDPRSLRIAGQEFLIVDGATPTKHQDVPGDPGNNVYQEAERQAAKNRPKSYASQLMLSVSGGLSGYGNPRFQTLPAGLIIPVGDSGLTVFDPFPMETKLERGWVVSPKVTLNTWRYFSNEFSYDRTATLYRLTSTDAIAGVSINLKTDAAISRFTYNTLIHFRPNGKRFRPYVAAGPAFQMVRLTESQPETNPYLKFAARDIALFVSAYDFARNPPMQGGGIFQVGLNYGGGAFFHITPRIFLRADYRETLSKQPDFWEDSPAELQSDLAEGGINFVYEPVINHGSMRHQIVTMGIGVSF